jgi:hypothetical protein
MFRTKRRTIATLGSLFVLLLFAAAFWLSPLGPGPGLPEGATRLHISTEAPHLVPHFGCPAALLGPVRVATAGDELIVLAVGTDEPVNVVWPTGWAAWRLDGRAELVGRDGTVIAREGDVIENRFGGGMGDDGAAHICIIGG